MPPSSSKMLARLKKGIAILGVLALLAGIIWTWELRGIWPRAFGDSIPRSVLEAVGMTAAGFVLLTKAQ